MNKILTYLGNFLIIFSLVTFVVIFYPLVTVLLFKPKPIENRLPETMYISIPKINAYAEVIENVDPWNQDEYLGALDKGVAHAKGTSLPGRPGRSYLFAHSSDAPWRMVRNNTPFLYLNRLYVGDQVLIEKGDITYVYEVVDKIVVEPRETQYLKRQGPTEMILQTCTPPGTSYKRLLVFTRPVEELPEKE